MMLGLMAVLISIVYKVNQVEVPKAKPVVASTNNEIVVPAGASVLQSSQSNGRITLTLRLADGSTAIQVHNAAGELVASYAIRER